MHRRQYIPLSQHKVSRRQLMRERQNILMNIAMQKAAERQLKEAEEEKKSQTFMSKLRKFVGAPFGRRKGT
jgi:hypothetical protein